jgi:hypothetical protein
VRYARVSTAEQTIEHQLARAKSVGFTIDAVVADNGVSGLHTRLVERPEGKRLFDKLRAGDTLVVRWVDRLGRNYEDVCDAIREFMRRGVAIRTVINKFTSTRDLHGLMSGLGFIGKLRVYVFSDFRLFPVNFPGFGIKGNDQEQGFAEALPMVWAAGVVFFRGGEPPVPITGQRVRLLLR